jgi:hypothetical protein
MTRATSGPTNQRASDDERLNEEFHTLLRDAAEKREGRGRGRGQAGVGRSPCPRPSPAERLTAAPATSACGLAARPVTSNMGLRIDVHIRT